MTARAHKWDQNLGSGLQAFVIARSHDCKIPKGRFPDCKIDDCKIPDCKIWDCKTVASAFGGL